MAATREVRANDQLVSRVIRKAITQFQSAKSIEEKLDALMTVSALAGVGLMTDRHFIQSTVKYIESRLS